MPSGVWVTGGRRRGGCVDRVTCCGGIDRKQTGRFKVRTQREGGTRSHTAMEASNKPVIIIIIFY